MKVLEQILKNAVALSASDIHLKHGAKPIFRIGRSLEEFSDFSDILDSKTLNTISQEILSESQWKKFLTDKDLDVSFGIKNLGRFRANFFLQRGSIRLVIRHIPMTIPTIDDLHLPAKLKEVAHYERGLVLVTGATGSGKSTTLASIINHINQTQKKHIITIEDPIEFALQDQLSIVSQRELGKDTLNFSSGLRSVLRQDPDIILIGEMRDKETMAAALMAAETGHLVFSTLHTADASESISRILSMFEPHQHMQIRLQLASSLKMIVSQRLAQSQDQKNFYPIVEILINNERIRNLVVDPERTGEITTSIESSHDSFGMQSFDQSLMQHLTEGKIDLAEALRLSSRPNDFELRYRGISNIQNAEYKSFESSVYTRLEEKAEKLDIIPIRQADDSENEDEESPRRRKRGK